MKIYNNYILILTILFLLTAVILTTQGENVVVISFTVFIIEALIVTELYVHFNARARRVLNRVTSILLAGFLGIVALEVISIVT